MSLPADLGAGAVNVLNTITGVSQVYTARPASLTSVPCVWVDEIRLNLFHTSGVRVFDNCELDVYIVCGGFDNEDAQAAADVLVTRVLDAFSDSPFMGGANVISEPVRVRSTSVDNGSGAIFPAWIVTIGRVSYSEGC